MWLQRHSHSVNQDDVSSVATCFGIACGCGAVKILAPQNGCAGGSYLGPVRLGICVWLQRRAHPVNEDTVRSVAACFGIRLWPQQSAHSGTPEWMCKRVLSWSRSPRNMRVAEASCTFSETRRRTLGDGLLRKSHVGAASCTFWHPRMDVQEGRILVRFASEFACGCSAVNIPCPAWMCRTVSSGSTSHRNLRVAAAPCTFRAQIERCRRV